MEATPTAQPTDVGPTDAKAQERQIGYEYRFQMSRDTQEVLVAINPDHYNKRFSAILKLHALLLDSIPFPYKVTQEPEVHILGGPRRRGIASVEVTVSFDITNDEARKQLEDKGFSEGTEPILG